MIEQENEFDVLIQAQKKLKEDNLRASMLGAVQKNRAEQPKIFELSNKTNLPVGVVERNVQQVQQTVDYEANEYDKLISDYPAISDFLSDPNRAALVYDDVSTLTHMSDYLRAGAAGGVSLGGAIKGFGDIGDAARRKLIGDPFEERETDTPEQAKFRQFYKTLFSAVDPYQAMRDTGEKFKTLAEFIRPPVERQSFGTEVTEGLGQLAGQIVLTITTGGAASSTAFAGLGADEMADRADADGAEQGDKDNAVLMGSLITAASERIGIDKILNRLPPAIKNKVMRGIADVMISGGIEATQEAAENVLFNLAEQITFDPDQDLLEGVQDSAEVGGAVGAIARSLILGGNKRFQRIERERAEADQAQTNKDQMKEFFGLAEKAEVLEKSPEQAEVLFQSMMDEQGIENFTVDAKEFVENIEDAGGNAAEVVERLGIEEAIASAAESGDQVEIPAGKFIAEFANSDLQEAALNSYRAGEETMTAHHGQAVLDRVQKETEAAIAEANLEADEIIAMESKADEVYDAVASAMLQGNVEVEVGQRHPIAELYRAFALRQMADWSAEGKDFDPFEFYENMGLRFTNDDGSVKPTVRETRDLQTSSLINELRGLKVGELESLERDAFGQSISEVARDRGINDDRGDLLSQDIDVDKVPFMKNMLNSDDGISLDELGEVLVQQGFFSERPETSELIDAIVQDFGAPSRNERVFNPVTRNDEKVAHLETLEALQEQLDRLGVDLDGLTNNEIIDLMDAAVRELNQDAGHEARGGIRGDFGNPASTFEIFTTKNADLSTLLHETGHLFLEMMNREAALDGAPQRVVENMKATLDYLGVDSFEQIETEHHEKFARTFEVYLRTGKAPTIRLRRAFDKFRAWLVSVYERLAGQYDISISEDVRNIFDTFLATEEDINEAEDSAGVEISSEIIELMNDSEIAQYRRNAEDAHSEALNRALAQKMRETTRKQTKEWKVNRERVEKGVADQVWSEPIYQVWHLIKKGEFYDQSTPDHLKGKKLNKQSLIDIFGSKGILKEIPHGMYSVEGGIDVEYLADRMGFANSVELIEALANGEKPQDRIQRITDETMELEYPKPSAAEVALTAIQNDRQSIFLETELKVLRKKNNNDNKKYNIDIIREAVERAVEETEIKNVMGKARTYLNNSRRAAKEAERALVAKDYETAMEEKRKQLFNYEMFRKISEASKQTNKMKSRLYKLANKKINPKTMETAYIARIKDLLHTYSFTDSNKPREARKAIDALEKFVLEQNSNATEEGRVEIQISTKLKEAADVTDWRDLTFEQLTALDETARSLAHIGRQESREQKEEHTQLVNEIAMSIEDNVRVRKKWGTVADQDTAKSTWWNNIAPAYLRRLPSLINEFDGYGFDGPMAKAILSPLEEATVKFEALLDPIRKRLDENQKNKYSFKETMALKKKVIYVAQLNEKLSKENLLALAHNWGNLGNRDAVLNGVFKGLSEADVENIFNEHMTKKDWDYVQENLDIVNSLWPEIAELQKRQTGVTPPKVESEKIVTPFGEYRGGYYPLKYSPINSMVANQKAREAATDAPVIGMASTTTRHGHTEERVTGHGLPVEMSMDVMYNHIGSVIHDLAYREAIQNAARVMRSKPVSEAIIKTKGPQAYEAMQLILSAQATGDAGHIRGWEKLSKHMRLNFAIAVIGLNMRSILTQPTGMLQAFVSNKVGISYMAKSLADFVAGGIHMRRNIKEIHDKSPYMERRSKVFRNELREQSHRIGTTGLRDKIVAGSFYPMIKLDAMISGIVWKGAYNKAQDQGLSEEQSIKYADRMVRDTQASGEQYQLSGLTNSGEFGKALTIFGSYFSATYNLTAESFNKAKTAGSARAWATFGMDMILLHGAQGFLAALLLEHWPDDEDEWGMWTTRALASQVFGQVPVVSSLYRSAMSGYGVSMLPADAVLNTTLGALKAVSKDIEEGEMSEATVKQMARAGSYLAGIPGVNGAIRAYEVYEDDPDADLLDILLRPKEK